MAVLKKWSHFQLQTLYQLCQAQLFVQVRSLQKIPARVLNADQHTRHLSDGQNDDNVFRIYKREYVSTKKYTSRPMEENWKAEEEEDIDSVSQEKEKGQTFGMLSSRFKHKFKPAGTDVIDELEDFEDYNDWVKPRVKRNTPIWYGNQMKKLVKEGKLVEAIEMLEVTMLKEARVQPTEYTYNILIGACGRAGYTDKAFKLFNRMKERGLHPSSVTYTALFNACSESPWPTTDGLTRLRKLHGQLMEKSVKVNLITHHAMMKAYAKCGDLKMTFELFRHLVDSGMQLVPKSFSFLLFACAEDKEAGFLYAVEAWREMMKQGIKPDIYIYNLLLRATRDCAVGDLETANRVLLRSVQPTVRDSHALPEGNTRGLKKGHGRRKESIGSIQQDAVSAGKDVEMMVIKPSGIEDLGGDKMADGSGSSLSSSSVETSFSDDAASYWWDSANQDSKQPSNVSKHSQHDEQNIGLVSLSKKSELVQRRTITNVDPTVLPNLLDLSSDFSDVQSLAAVSDPSDRLTLLGGAKGVIDSMTGNEVKPDVKTLTLLAEILPATRTQEDDLLSMVDEQKCKVDVDFYNAFIRRRTRRRDLKGAKALLPTIRQKGLFPNLRTYVNLAAGCNKPEDGFQLLKDMEEAGVQPTCHVYSALIGATQRYKDYGYLIEILKHMEAKGVIPNERTIGQLERIAAFGQNKGVHTHSAVNKKELNMFRGFYNKWLSQMKVDVPQHPWAKFRRSQHDTKAGDNSIETAI